MLPRFINPAGRTAPAAATSACDERSDTMEKGVGMMSEARSEAKRRIEACYLCRRYNAFAVASLLPSFAPAVLRSSSNLTSSMSSRNCVLTLGTTGNSADPMRRATRGGGGRVERSYDELRTPFHIFLVFGISCDERKESRKLFG